MFTWVKNTPPAAEKHMEEIFLNNTYLLCLFRFFYTVITQKKNRVRKLPNNAGGHNPVQGGKIVLTIRIGIIT